MKCFILLMVVVVTTTILFIVFGRRSFMDNGGGINDITRDDYVVIAEKYYWSKERDHFVNAAIYYDKAMQQGDALSMIRLSEIYYFGLNGKINHKRSQKFIEMVLDLKTLPENSHHPLFIARARYTDELFLKITRRLIDENYYPAFMTRLPEDSDDTFKQRLVLAAQNNHLAKAKWIAKLYGLDISMAFDIHNNDNDLSIDHGYDLDPVAYKKMAGYYGARKKFLSMMREGEDYERARLFWFIPYIYGWTKYDSILLRTASQDQNSQHP